jgi:hypothetical protein
MDEVVNPHSERRRTNDGGAAVAETDGIGLADALEVLRQELVDARAKAVGSGLQFPIKTLTVELKVIATKSREGKAGFKVPVIDAQLGGSAGVGHESVQTVTVIFGSPVDDNGRPVKLRRGDAPDEG